MVGVCDEYDSKEDSGKESWQVGMWEGSKTSRRRNGQTVNGAGGWRKTRV